MLSTNVVGVNQDGMSASNVQHTFSPVGTYSGVQGFAPRASCCVEGTFAYGGDGGFTLFDLTANRTSQTHRDFGDIVGLFPLRGEVIVAGADGRLCRAGRPGSCMATLPKRLLSAASLVAADTILCSDEDGGLQEYHPDLDRVVGHDGPLPGLCYLLEGPQMRSSLVLGRCQNTVAICDLRSNDTVTMCPRNRGVAALSAAMDGAGTAVLAAYSDCSVHLWDVRSPREVMHTVAMASQPTHVRAVPHALGFVVGSYDGYLSRFDAARGNVARLDPPEAIAPQPSRHPTATIAIHEPPFPLQGGGRIVQLSAAAAISVFSY